MRKIFNLLKKVYVEVDRFWVNSSGWPVEVLGNVVNPDNGHPLYVEDKPKQINYFHPTTKIFGFYEKENFGGSNVRLFGIDVPDEIYIEFNLNEWKSTGLSEKGLLLSIEDEKFMCIGMNILHQKFWGKSRIGLTCQRFQESTTSGCGGSITLTPGCGGKSENPNNCCN